MLGSVPKICFIVLLNDIAVHVSLVVESDDESDAYS